MNAPPQDGSNYQPNEDLVRLRKRVADMLRLGAATPETFLQTIMQIWQETERRRSSCMQDADDHLRKFHALTAQAAGFASMGSILYSIVNGYATLEERRVQEMIDREKEKAEHAPEAPASKVAEVPVINEGSAQEAAGDLKVKPSGGKRKKA